MAKHSREKAIGKWLDLFGVMKGHPNFDPFWIYKFPSGHWACATVGSPVGQLIEKTGEIYPTVKAIKKELIPYPHEA